MIEYNSKVDPKLSTSLSFPFRREISGLSHSSLLIIIAIPDLFAGFVKPRKETG